MTTPNQIKANQENSLKGGVKTPEGKNIVSKNAVTHGITSTRLISDEEKELYQNILDILILETSPDGYLEHILCERIAFHQMKLLRLATVESIFIQANTLQSEIDYLTEKQPQKILLHQISFDDFGFSSSEGYSSAEAEKISLEYGLKIKSLNEQIWQLKKNSIALSSLDTLERLQRYDTNIENRLIKAIREYQKLKELKRSNHNNIA